MKEVQSEDKDEDGDGVEDDDRLGRLDDNMANDASRWSAEGPSYRAISSVLLYLVVCMCVCVCSCIV